MRETTNTVVVHASPESLWDYLADYERSIKIATDTAHARLEDGTPGRPGTTYEGWLEWEGIGTSWLARLSEANRPAALTWESDSHGGECRMRFELQPDGDQVTNLRVTLAWGATEATAPLEPFAWGLITPMFRHALRKLEGLHLD